MGIKNKYEIRIAMLSQACTSTQRRSTSDSPITHHHCLCRPASHGRQSWHSEFRPQFPDSAILRPDKRRYLSKDWFKEIRANGTFMCIALKVGCDRGWGGSAPFWLQKCRNTLCKLFPCRYIWILDCKRCGFFISRSYFLENGGWSIALTSWSRTK